MSAVSVKGTLPIGVEIDGERHREFEIRSGTLRDAIALSEIEGYLDLPENRKRYAGVAQRLSIDGVPPETITLEFLLDMVDRDFIVIDNAADEVEKKLDALSSS